VSAENYKNAIMTEEFRQNMLHYTSAQSFNLDETKRPTLAAVNESFRKLSVD